MSVSKVACPVAIPSRKMRRTSSQSSGCICAMAMFMAKQPRSERPNAFRFRRSPFLQVGGVLGPTRNWVVPKDCHERADQRSLLSPVDLEAH